MLRDAVARIVDAEDPEGLLESGAPADEYSSEVDALTALVERGGVDEEQVLAVWEHWFGPDSSLSRAPERLLRLITALREVGEPAAPEVSTDEHGRPEPPMQGSETATLSGFLDHQRARSRDGGGA